MKDTVTQGVYRHSMLALVKISRGDKVGASKLKKAEGCGTKIINEQELLGML